MVAKVNLSMIGRFVIMGHYYHGTERWCRQGKRLCRHKPSRAGSSTHRKFLTPERIAKKLFQNNNFFSLFLEQSGVGKLLLERTCF